MLDPITVDCPGGKNPKFSMKMEIIELDDKWFYMMDDLEFYLFAQLEHAKANILLFQDHVSDY
ncbi:hypothetical protein C0J52_08113 [Blattella germanica]|nr:hypothetical protein C0J52_08113 [Blattella germanica]